MPISKTSICNKALRKIGAKSLLNVDTDTSREATLCKASYDEVLQEVLRMHNWNFAIFRQSLNKDLSFTPIYQYNNRFILPTIPIFLRLISVENNPDFRIENNFLLTNKENINIRFIGKETDVNKYDSLFTETLALKLAYEISYTLNSDETRTARIKEDFIESLSLAKRRDNQEDNDVYDNSGSYNYSRFTNFNFVNATSINNA